VHNSDMNCYSSYSLDLRLLIFIVRLLKNIIALNMCTLNHESHILIPDYNLYLTADTLCLIQND